MDHLPSPSVAEKNQRRKRAFLPPIWPLVVIIAVVVVIAIIFG